MISILKIENLEVSFDANHETVQALGPISLEIESGDIVAIIGPSGCGKSTLLNVLSGLIKTPNANITLNQDLLNPKKHQIGFVPQNFGLLPWKTVYQNCFLALTIKGIKMDTDQVNRIDTIMERLNIQHLVNRFPRELSGGQQQRVSLARSFVMNPDLLLMDEPFSALDALTREEAQDLFLDMWNSYHTTTIFVTHNIDEAIYMGKKIIMLSHSPGKIIEIIDNPLFNQPNIREDEKYLEISSHIRRIIKKGWLV